MKLNTSSIVLLVFLLLSFNFLFFLGMKLIEFSLLSNVIRAITIILLLIVYYVRQIDVKYVFYFSSCFFILFLLNGNMYAINLVYISLIIGLLRSYNVQEMIEYLFYTSLAIALSHFVLYCLGFSANSSNVYYIGERVRFTFGFENPNALAVFYASLFYSAFFYYSIVLRRFTLIAIAIMSISLVIIYLSNSRTTLFSLIVFGGMLAAGRFYFLKKIIRGLAILAPFLFSFLTIAMCMMYDTKINDLLSFRPVLIYSYIKDISDYGFFVGAINPTKTIDNVYVLLFSVCGLPIYIFILFYMSYEIWKMGRDYSAFIFSVLLASVFESFLIRPELPVSILFFVLIYADSRRAKFYKKLTYS